VCYDFKSFFDQRLAPKIGYINKYRHFKIEKINGIVTLSRKKDAVEKIWVTTCC
jgi:hypothetical protein